MNLSKELPKLVQEGIISQESADAIENYYARDKIPTQSRLMAVFGVIGAILVGLGIILIIAHNWDSFSRPIKTGFSLLPLIIGQLTCGYTLLKRKSSQAWREASASFLFFAIGACISLISQVYNIPGNMGAFLLTWMLLFLPIPFVMKSSVANILLIAGATSYATEVGYWQNPNRIPFWYCLLMGAGIFYHLQTIQQRPESNGIPFLNWIIPLSLTICLGSIAEEHEEIMFLAYMSMFAIFTQIGNRTFFSNQASRNNGYRIIGWLGSIIVLLILSFDFIWEGIRKEAYDHAALVLAPEIYATFLISVFALFLSYQQWSKDNLRVSEILFFPLILIYILGSHSTFAFVLVNTLLFAYGLLTIIHGTKVQNLLIMNSGLLIIAALIVCRFFDTDLSFVVRGILFLSIGFGFFITNYQLLKKKKENA